MIRSIKSFGLRGQTILMRLDLNVPMHNEKIEDDFRIRSCLPTINFCLKAGASIVIMSHLGRPKGQYDPNYSLISCRGGPCCYVRNTYKIFWGLCFARCY